MGINASKWKTANKNSTIIILSPSFQLSPLSTVTLCANPFRPRLTSGTEIVHIYPFAYGKFRRWTNKRDWFSIRSSSLLSTSNANENAHLYTDLIDFRLVMEKVSILINTYLYRYLSIQNLTILSILLQWKSYQFSYRYLFVSIGTDTPHHYCRFTYS